MDRFDTHYEQLIDIRYLKYKPNYTWKHEHGKYCRSAAQAARMQQGQLTGRGPVHQENTKNTVYTFLEYVNGVLR